MPCRRRIDRGTRTGRCRAGRRPGRCPCCARPGRPSPGGPRAARSAHGPSNEPERLTEAAESWTGAVPAVATVDHRRWGSRARRTDLGHQVVAPRPRRRSGARGGVPEPHAYRAAVPRRELESALDAWPRGRPHPGPAPGCPTKTAPRGRPRDRLGPVVRYADRGRPPPAGQCGARRRRRDLRRDGRNRLRERERVRPRGGLRRHAGRRAGGHDQLVADDLGDRGTAQGRQRARRASTGRRRGRTAAPGRWRSRRRRCRRRTAACPRRRRSSCAGATAARGAAAAFDQRSVAGS